MFNQSGREPEVIKANVPTLGAGPMMMLRAMGIDPEQIFQTFAGLETMLRGAVAEVLERSQVLGANVETIAVEQIGQRVEVAEVKMQLVEVNARLDRSEANQLRLIESMGPLMLAIQRIEAGQGFMTERTPAKETGSKKPNGRAH